MPNLPLFRQAARGFRLVNHSEGGSGVALRIRLLGEFSVQIGDRLIPEKDWRLNKARALVKLLALAPRHRLGREEMMERLWPDAEPEAAQNNLYYALHVARAALDRDPATKKRHASMLLLADGVIALAPSISITIDVEAFRGAAAAARLSNNAQAYQAALDIYTGELLPDDRYADWAARPREALRDLHLQLLSELALVHQQRGKNAAAIDTLSRLVAEEPTHEEACASLMRLHAASGQRWAALRDYAHLRSALRDELDLQPAASITELYARIFGGSVGTDVNEPHSVARRLVTLSA
jgi:DNA-binding SARP family transcriptional activator